jgi:hypothetical protein
VALGDMTREAVFSAIAEYLLAEARRRHDELSRF